ncbi:MAG: hypothetical protein ACLUGP_12505 [Faecalibacterium prausnitzii]
MFYCLSGEGQFYLAGQLFPVKPDDMVIVNPQVEHTELSLNASPFGVYRAGRCQHGVFVQQGGYELRHLQLPGEPGADGHVAAHAAGRGRPQLRRLRDRLSGPAGGTADLAGALHHHFAAAGGGCPDREPGVRRDQAVSGHQLPRGYLAGPAGRACPPEQILSGPHLPAGVRHFPHYLPEPPPH